MKEYIWEKACNRTLSSIYYDKFDEGLISVATFIRLIGGEIRGVYHGYDRSLEKDNDHVYRSNSGSMVLEENLVPLIYFSYPNAPYFSYKDEPKVVEKIAAENQISMMEFVNRTDFWNKAFEEYSKSSQTKEWKSWMKKAVKLSEEVDKFVNEFNKLKSDPVWKIITWGYKDSGKLVISVKHSNFDIQDPDVQRKMAQEKRQELLKKSLGIFSDFAQFLRAKYIKAH